MKKFCIPFFVFLSLISFSQNDTSNSRGTIKIKKVKKEIPHVYIYAQATFGNYNLVNKKYTVANADIFQPFPIVEGHVYPFNYTGFFNDVFKNKTIDLGGKEMDTVTIEVKVLANGKVYVKDKSKVLYVNGIAAFYNDEVAGYEINNLHLNCMESLKNIKQWLPAYYIRPKKDKFKNTVVIKPTKEKVDAQGIVRIIFSASPFDY